MEDYKDQEEIYSNKVRAGKRTYFFDVKATKAQDYYLTITESKRIFDDKGNLSYKKHKIFLYKEDFENFKKSLNDSIEFIISEKGDEVISKSSESELNTQKEGDKFTDVSFDDI
jgi:C-terminal processing protease CtpA/Prc